VAERNLSVNLALTDRFTGRLALAAQAARDLHASWVLRDATWEPHDWSDFA
jgi:hypothetical protein